MLIDEKINSLQNLIKRKITYEELAISKNEYVGKYCLKVDFKTQDCKDYIKATTKATINQDVKEEEIAKKIFELEKL